MKISSITPYMAAILFFKMATMIEIFFFLNFLIYLLKYYPKWHQL